MIPHQIAFDTMTKTNIQTIEAVPPLAFSTKERVYNESSVAAKPNTTRFQLTSVGLTFPMRAETSWNED